MRAPLCCDDVTFCTVSVGRSVDSCSPLTGDTAAGVVSVTGPEFPPPPPDGPAGLTGICLLAPVPLPHAEKRTAVKISASVDCFGRECAHVASYSSNNVVSVNLFIKIIGLR